MLAFLESLEFLEILRLLKLENFITMVRRNLGSATPPSVMALLFHFLQNEQYFHGDEIFHCNLVEVVKSQSYPAVVLVPIQQLASLLQIIVMIQLHQSKPSP